MCVCACVRALLLSLSTFHTVYWRGGYQIFTNMTFGRNPISINSPLLRCDVWWKMNWTVLRPAVAMKYHIHIHFFTTSCEQKSWGEAMSDSSTLLWKKKPRSRVPLQRLSYEIGLRIHCCRYISFLYVYWFWKIFGDIQHKEDWILEKMKKNQ